MNRDDLSIGQQVVIHDRNESRDGPDAGEVVKIGRLLVTIKSSYGREAKYGIEDQTIRDAYEGQWFRTLEQEAAAERRAVADVATLAARGFSLSGRPRATDDDLRRVAELLCKVTP